MTTRTIRCTLVYRDAGGREIEVGSARGRSAARTDAGLIGAARRIVGPSGASLSGHRLVAVLVDGRRIEV